MIEKLIADTTRTVDATAKYPRANVSKICCAQGCKRVAVQAEKLSTFWVSRCAECSTKEITLDFDKVMGDVKRG